MTLLPYFTRERLLLLSNLIPLVLLLVERQPLYLLLWMYFAEFLAVILWAWVRFFAAQRWAFKGDNHIAGELLLWVITSVIPAYFLGLFLLVFPMIYWTFIAFITAGAQGNFGNSISSNDIVLGSFSFAGSFLGYFIAHGILFLRSIKEKKLSDYPPAFHLFTPVIYGYPMVVAGFFIFLLLTSLKELATLYTLPLSVPQMYFGGMLLLVGISVFADIKRDIYVRELSKKKKFSIQDLARG